MKPILEITEPDFEEEVLKSEQPVLVNFWTEWSQPCRILGPVLEEVAAGCNGRAKVVKVIVDDNPELGMWYRIQFIPTLLYFINGEERGKIVGTASKKAILAKLESLISFQKQANASTPINKKHMNATRDNQDSNAEIKTNDFDARGNLAAVEIEPTLRRPNANGEVKIPTGPPPNLGAAKKRLRRTLAKWECVPLALFCGISLTACNRQAASPPPPPEVATVTVVGQPVLLTTELPGRTSPYRVAEIRPQVSGHILKRLFTEGSDVRADEELYQIDPAPFQAALESAVANLPSLRSRAARYQAALADKSVSQQDFDDADGALKQCEAVIETARINLGYTRVDSPIPGRIGRSSVTDGAIVTAYQPVALATVQQLDPIYVDVPQSTTELLRLERRLQEGSVNHDGTNANQVQLILEDGSQYPLEGTLQFREVTVDPTTGSVILRMVFPNPNEVLLPDMFVRAVVKEGVKVNAILVPQQAVARDPKGNPFVWVVAKDGKVEHRSLNVDRAIGDQWLVSSGLESGEHIIVEGLLMARPVKGYARAAACY